MIQDPTLYLVDSRVPLKFVAPIQLHPVKSLQFIGKMQYLVALLFIQFSKTNQIDKRNKLSTEFHSQTDAITYKTLNTETFYRSCSDGHCQTYMEKLTILLQNISRNNKARIITGYAF